MADHLETPRRSPIRTAARVAAAHGARTAGGAILTTLGWPAVAAVLFAAAAAALILVTAAIMSISRMNADQATFVYQCQSRLGGAVGTTASVQVITRVATPQTSGAAPTLSYELRYLQPAALPSATTTAPPLPARADSPPPAAPQRNPYAALTAAPSADERTAACAAAMKTGEFVTAPVHTRGGEPGRQVAELALRQTDRPVSATDSGPAGATRKDASPAAWVKSVYYEASRGEVVMPDTLAAQIGVGQRVDPSAISPGDLVFYRFTPDAGPTAVMIAVNATHGIDTNQPMGVAPLPAGNVIVKRPHMEPR